MNDQTIIRVGQSPYFYCVTLEQIQDIWAMVTANPGVTVRAAASQAGMKYQRARQIMIFLEQAGYIQHEKGRTGRKVLMPMVHRL